jgi:hypothetical protein
MDSPPWCGLPDASTVSAVHQLSRNKFHLSGKTLPKTLPRLQPDAVFLDRMSQVAFPEEKILPRREMTAGPRRADKNKRPREGNVVDLNQRIEAMHKRDVLVAWAFVIGLWCAMIFVTIATWDLAPNGAARILLLVGGAIVLIFNTAAILAMLRHYREDRDFIYGLDIKFQDEARGRG